MNRWTLEVNDFGKLGHAKVTVSPLTLFLGENNSGKSYLMTLIYGCLSLDLSEDYEKTGNYINDYKPAFEIVKEKILCLNKKENMTFTLSGKEIKVLNNWINYIINSVFFGMYLSIYSL